METKWKFDSIEEVYYEDGLNIKSPSRETKFGSLDSIQQAIPAFNHTAPPNIPKSFEILDTEKSPDKASKRVYLKWICFGQFLLWITLICLWASYFVVQNVNVQDCEDDPKPNDFWTNSTSCIAKVGLTYFPCIFPFKLNGVKYHECLDDNKTGIPECPVSKNKRIWGVCDHKKCNQPDLSESVVPNSFVETFPFMVQLVNHDAVVCGGILISPKHVLIASHCINNLEQAGLMITPNHDLHPEGQMISKVVNHEDGLSILELHTNVNNSKPVQFMNLISDEEIHHLKSKNLEFFGWDSSKKTVGKGIDYQHVQMEISSPDQCEKTLQAVGLRNLVDESNICAYIGKFDTEKGNFCRGAKTGVLYYKEKDQIFVVGILKSPESMCQPYLPSFFWKMRKYLTWMANIVEPGYNKDCSYIPYIKQDGRIACGVKTSSSLNQTEAKKTCESKNASLPDIRSLDENNYYHQYMKDAGWKEMWIDVTLRPYSGISIPTFISGGSPVTFTNWEDLEPNNVDFKEDCVLMEKGGGKWLDRSCDVNFGFICEKVIFDGRRQI